MSVDQVSELEMTDSALVQRVLTGDVAAYETLARRWFYRILAYCQSRLMLPGRHDAEDLTQEVLIRGYAELGRLQHGDRFGAWLRGIAQHVCVDWQRQHRRDHVPAIEAVKSIETGSTAPLETVVADDERALVMRQISELPEDLREVILLHYFDNLTYDEMAEWLGIARASVSERLAKARALLRIRLAPLRGDR